MWPTRHREMCEGPPVVVSLQRSVPWREGLCRSCGETNTVLPPVSASFCSACHPTHTHTHTLSCFVCVLRTASLSLSQQVRYEIIRPLHCDSDATLGWDMSWSAVGCKDRVSIMCSAIATMHTILSSVERLPRILLPTIRIDRARLF